MSPHLEDRRYGLTNRAVTLTDPQVVVASNELRATGVYHFFYPVPGPVASVPASFPMPYLLFFHVDDTHLVDETIDNLEDP